MSQLILAQREATGGPLPLTWSQTGLPEGLTLDAATGVITGFPARADTFVSTITARDSTGAANAAVFPIVIQRNSAQSSKLSFVPIAPCRLMETRSEYNFEGRTGTFGPPFVSAGETRTLTVPASNVCQVPAAASAFVLNVTVIPRGPVDYVTVFPGDESRPDFRTVSSPDSQIVANSAIVRAGSGGTIKVYASHNTDLIVDISGYFTASPGLAYYPVTPCRAVETRTAYRTPAGPFGPPTLNTRETRRFRLPDSPYCTLPRPATAYSATVTVVPTSNLPFLTIWQSGNGQPNVSTMNSFSGRVLANNAILPASSDGSIDVFAFERTDLLIDITGYFAPDDGVNGLFYYPLVQCRLANSNDASYSDTFGGPIYGNETTRTIQVAQSPRCTSIPAASKGYALNVTAIPAGSPMPFLTVYPAGMIRPNASVLNAFQGQTVSNALITPAGTAGAVDLYTYRATHLIVEISGYFAR